MKNINWAKVWQIFLVIFPLIIAIILPVINLINVFNRKDYSNMSTGEIITIVASIVVPIVVSIAGVIGSVWLSNRKVKNKLSKEHNEIKNLIGCSEGENLRAYLGTGTGENIKAILIASKESLITQTHELEKILAILKERSDRNEHYQPNNFKESVAIITNTITEYGQKIDNLMKQIEDLKDQNRFLKDENQKLHNKINDLSLDEGMSL
ncbi:hypothetical protein [Spiroplasma sp. SV19]|uniref:hypothetical protein n=1 Tax=Spiroplasma sp. SV19 TaxID=2570468 RepID=UPI0024B6BBEA|nr:hypothetical protein [Spiroplasma sp. SV19]WHQ37071.1 hypothetical protein E7Y35_04135 [Spiroplasma sp. SV19]